MNVSELFIRRPVGTSLLAAGILLLGVVAYHFLPVAPLPKVDYPTISLSAPQPRGAGFLLLGVVAYHFLPVAPLPKVDYPTIHVSAQQPGVDVNCRVIYLRQ